LVLDHGDKVRVYCKGASELVLDLCSNFISQDGKVVSLDETSKKLDFQLVSLEDENLQKNFKEVN